MINYFKDFIRSYLPLCLVVLTLSSGAKTMTAQEVYSLLLDHTFSMPVGAQNLLTVHRLEYSLENTFIPLQVFDENTPFRKTAGISYRFAKSLCIDFPVDYVTVLVQHEVFGHGSRIREYGGRDITYELHLPMPYDVGGGLTSWNYSTPVSNDEEIAVTIGGVEASALLSGHLIDHCVQRGKISSREAFLYTLASNDVTYYLWRTQREGSHGESNDMSSYEDAVNAREGFSENHKLTIDDLARQNIISKFLDPFQYIALFTFLKTYLWDGENSCDLPMISLGNVKYLPAFRFGLAPFGSEVYLDNYFVRSERVLKFSLRYGIPTFQHSWGIGCSVTNLLQTEFVSLGGSLDLWNQPFLEGFIGSHTLPRSGTGKAVSINAKFKLIDTFASIHVITEIRTKTAGYLQGEPLSDAFLWRAGLQVVTR